MASDHASSVQAVALRATKLNADGTPVVGENNSYVTNAFARIGFTPEYDEGEEIQERAADGTLCTYYKADDVLKRVAMEVAVCKPEPEIYELLAGGTLLQETTEIVGWASPGIGEIATPNGIALEVWSKAIVGGKLASVNPYFHYVFPIVKLRPDGERALENGIMANVFNGFAFENPAFGDGPTGDWPYSVESAYQWARRPSAPTGIQGYVEVTAGS
jgi:hypothetical protein